MCHIHRNITTSAISKKSWLALLQQPNRSESEWRWHPGYCAAKSAFQKVFYLFFPEHNHTVLLKFDLNFAAPEYSSVFAADAAATIRTFCCVWTFLRKTIFIVALLSFHRFGSFGWEPSLSSTTQQPTT